MIPHASPENVKFQIPRGYIHARHACKTSCLADVEFDELDWKRHGPGALGLIFDDDAYGALPKKSGSAHICKNRSVAEAIAEEEMKGCR